MLLVIFGPPAVGKMTVGRAVAAVSDFRLFHNHMTIEPMLETFGFGTPGFNVLNGGMRRQVLEQAAAHDINLVFSVVWALDDEQDRRTMVEYLALFGGQAAFVELRAGLDVRLERNGTEHRLQHKPSKRDLAWSDENVRQMDQEWQMTSESGPGVAGELLAGHPHLVLDTTHQSSGQSAVLILDWLAQQHIRPRWQARRAENCPDDVARLLGTLPEWFGIEEANRHYVEQAGVLETWTVADAAGAVVGVALVDRSSPMAPELILLAVDRAHHGQGIGTALVTAIEQDARRTGVPLLQVKTLGASHADAGYARTRLFYEARGFLALGELDLWGPESPCLMMVKPL